jgi:hypothetical protein
MDGNWQTGLNILSPINRPGGEMFSLKTVYFPGFQVPGHSPVSLLTGLSCGIKKERYRE